MKKILLVTLGACAALSTVALAEARQGCGPGFHRGPHDRCRPNRGPVVVSGPVIGTFYAGHGYWDGRRYWQHRDHWHNGWRYR